MMTQTPQPLTADLGFALPAGITAAGCEGQYLEIMHRAGALYEVLYAWNPAVASYVIPNGYHRRVLFTMNLRQVCHFCNLRGASNAHFSIRRVAYQMAEAVTQAYPLLGKYLDLPAGETWQSIEAQHFRAINVR